MAALKPRKKKPPAPPRIIRTLALTSQDTRTLAWLAQDASDATGWTVSGSAVMWALLRYADQQGAAWVWEQLTPLIEHEIEGGTVWGRKK